MVCNPVARYCKVIILSSSERKVDLYRYQCNILLLSSVIEDDWRVAKSPRVVLLRILEQMDQLHNLEYQVSILRLPASISRIGTATTVILSNRPGISLPPFCDVEMGEVVVCVVWGLVGERGWLLAEEGEGWDRFTEGRWCGESTKSGS